MTGREVVAVVDRITSTWKITTVQRPTTVVAAVDVTLTANPKLHLDDNDPIMISTNKRKSLALHVKINRRRRIQHFIGREISPIAIINSSGVHLGITTVETSSDDPLDRVAMRKMPVTRTETIAEEKRVLNVLRTTMNRPVVSRRTIIATRDLHRKEIEEVLPEVFLLKRRVSNVPSVTRTCVAIPRAPPNSNLLCQYNPIKINGRITTNKVESTLVPRCIERSNILRMI